MPVRIGAAVILAVLVATGYVVPRAAGVREAQAIAVYSIFVFVFAAAWDVLLTKRLARTAQPA